MVLSGFFSSLIPYEISLAFLMLPLRFMTGVTRYYQASGPPSTHSACPFASRNQNKQPVRACILALIQRCQRQHEAIVSRELPRRKDYLPPF